MLRDRPDRVDLLFVGDSITEGWLADGRATWDREYAPLHPYNLGIGGDETQHVLWRLDHGEVDGLNPGAVVLLIGTNNLGNAGHTPEQTAAGVAGRRGPAAGEAAGVAGAAAGRVPAGAARPTTGPGWRR